MSKTDILKEVEEAHIFEMNFQLMRQEAFAHALELYHTQTNSDTIELKRSIKARFSDDGTEAVIYGVPFESGFDPDEISLLVEGEGERYFLDEVDFDWLEVTKRILDELD